MLCCNKAPYSFTEKFLINILLITCQVAFVLQQTYISKCNSSKQYDHEAITDEIVCHQQNLFSPHSHSFFRSFFFFLTLISDLNILLNFSDSKLLDHFFGFLKCVCSSVILQNHKLSNNIGLMDSNLLFSGNLLCSSISKTLISPFCFCFFFL